MGTPGSGPQQKTVLILHLKTVIDPISVPVDKMIVESISVQIPEKVFVNPVVHSIAILIQKFLDPDLFFLDDKPETIAVG